MKSEPEAVVSGLQHYLLAREYRSGYKTRPVWNDTDTPLAYLISFRSYGTWLHGDERGSIDRFHNRYKSPYLLPNDRWRKYNAQRLKAKQRRSVETAIRETCAIRNWYLHAVSVRTNHVHSVVSAGPKKPGLILN